jgi:anti-sigma B factor antagonist
MTVPTEPPPEARLDVPVTTEWANGAVVLRVSGDVDYVTAPQVTAAVAALAERPTVAVIDLLGVSFFGSAGLTLLVATAQAAKLGTRVRVVAGPAALRPVLVAGLEGVLAIYPTVGEALVGSTV